jgi:hypothetical protein
MQPAPRACYRRIGMRRRISERGLVAVLLLALFATSASADGRYDGHRTGTWYTIDVDEQVTSPVPHRYIHGLFGDAKFQLALPDDWNGKLLIGSRGFSGDEFSSGAFKTVGLEKGFAYTLSDEGWSRTTIADSPEDSYYESRLRIVQLTYIATKEVKRHYGRRPSRTYMTGGSNGGHHTKWMVEDYPDLYDGGFSGYGFNSQVDMWGSMPVFMRNYDVIAARIDDIIAARAANPDWNPSTMPLSPPLTAAQIAALNNIYSIPAVMGNGFRYNVGRPPGSEFMWPSGYVSMMGYIRDSIRKFDPSFDPNRDGVVTEDEMKLWDAHASPKRILRENRKLDVTGNLRRPMLVVHGALDVIVSPYESVGYKRMVEKRLGRRRARELHALYFIPGMGHGGTPFNNLIGEAYDTLDAWVDWHRSRGKRGSLPPDVLGGYVRE